MEMQNMIAPVPKVLHTKLKTKLASIEKTFKGWLTEQIERELANED